MSGPCCKQDATTFICMPYWQACYVTYLICQILHVLYIMLSIHTLPFVYHISIIIFNLMFFPLPPAVPPALTLVLPWPVRPACLPWISALLSYLECNSGPAHPCPKFLLSQVQLWFAATNLSLLWDAPHLLPFNKYLINLMPVSLSAIGFTC